MIKPYFKCQKYPSCHLDVSSYMIAFVFIGIESYISMPSYNSHEDMGFTFTMCLCSVLRKTHNERQREEQETEGEICRKFTCMNL